MHFGVAVLTSTVCRNNQPQAGENKEAKQQPNGEAKQQPNGEAKKLTHPIEISPRVTLGFHETPLM
jgi:hypothetical protein